MTRLTESYYIIAQRFVSKMWTPAKYFVLICTTLFLTAQGVNYAHDVLPVDHNHNPYFVDENGEGIQLLNVYVSENTPNYLIGNIQAIDEDEDDTLTYSLISEYMYYAVNPDDPQSYSDFYTINSETGEVRISSSGLDYEAFPHTYHPTHIYQPVPIKVEDGNGGSSQFAYNVYIADANDNAPVFSADNQSLSINENEPSDTTVGTVSATDADLFAGDHTYSIETENVPFTIESSKRSGAIKTTPVLDYEATRAYTLTVKVDDGFGTDTISVTINVTDINEAPVFATNSAIRAIVEGTSANRNIGLPVSATDEDASDTLTYTLGGTDATSFDIVSTTGQLKTKASLNYDTKNTYAVTVTATDADGLFDAISVTINIIEAVDFTDSGLAAAVRSTLRIAVDAPILSDSFAALTRLTASRRSITDLTGLEQATELTRLDLGHNRIDDLGPLANLTRLTNLDIANNLIVDVASLSGLSSLQILDLRSNNVGDVTPLSTMTHLTQLYLRGNDNLSNVKQLVKLKEAGTRIDITLPRPVSIPDANLKAALQGAITGVDTGDPIFPEDMETLTTLDASNLSITTLTGLEKATNLTSLTLSNNPNVHDADKISSISSLSRLTKLLTLNLSGNKISSISSLSGLTALTSLDLSRNRISGISSLSRLIALTSLDLSENTISSISTLSRLTALTALDLANNRITDVLALQGLSSLSTLDLSGNTGLTMEKAAVLYKLVQVGTTITLPQGITLPTQANIVVFNNAALEATVRSTLRIRTGYPILTENITDLTSLTATSKQIDDLTGLAGATALTRLDVGNNEIADLAPLQNLTNLTNLDLADNQIETLIPLQNLANLTNLDLDDNLIEDVSGLSNLTSLTNLDLRGNDVMDVAPLRNLTSLRYIYLRGNENLTNLEWLGAIENLRADISLPDVARLPDTNLDAAVRTALGDAGNTVSNDLPMSEDLLESLETLTASSQNITDLTGCEYMTGLTSLDLGSNDITDVTPLSKLYSLETLVLDGNPILDTSVLRELERRGTNIDITIYRYPSWDVNQDSKVDETDVFLITATITNESPDVNGDGSIDADDTDAADANKDGSVDTDDLLLVFEKFDRPVNLGAPLLSAGLDWRLLEQIDVDRLGMQLEILRAENDGSLKYQKAITFLQVVLTALQPNQTLLLANYPNPFNPETWIPYQLANGSNVRITIYDARGAVVRRLVLGYRAEGYYRVHGRAAHWDGHNGVGERVASGIYFYQLETDSMSFLRKMVNLK